MKIIILALAVGLLTQACTNKKKNKSEDLVHYSVELKLKDKNTLSGEAKKIVSEINAGKEISFSQVTNLFVSKHSYANSIKYEADLKKDVGGQLSSEYIEQLRGDHLQYISKIMGGIKNKSYLSIKSQYESKIEEENGKKLIYNYKASTTPDIQYESKMQCYSGTSLNLIISRMLVGGTKYRADNRVVVLSASHIRPGQILNVAGQNRLYIVETTATGDAILDMGKVKDLNSCLRIVDADHFVLVDTLSKGLTVENKISLRDSLTEMTDRMYGIDSKKLLASCRLNLNSGESSDSRSGFSVESEDSENVFAVSETKHLPAGDQERVSTGLSFDRIQESIQLEQSYFEQEQECKKNKTKCMDQGAMGMPLIKTHLKDWTEDEGKRFVVFVINREISAACNKKSVNSSASCERACASFFHTVNYQYNYQYPAGVFSNKAVVFESNPGGQLDVANFSIGFNFDEYQLKLMDLAPGRGGLGLHQRFQEGQEVFDIRVFTLNADDTICRDVSYR